MSKPEETTQHSVRQKASKAQLDVGVPVTESFLQRELAKLASSLQLTLSASLTVSISASISDSFKQEFTSIKDRLDSCEHELKVLREEREAESIRINKRLEAIERSGLYNHIQHNQIEQRGRDKTAKLHNFISTKTDSLELMEDVYNQLIVPAFTEAVKDKKIKFIPSLTQIVEYGHRLKPRPNGNPASILVVFTSRFYYFTFMHYVKPIVLSLKGNPVVQDGDDDSDGNITPATQQPHHPELRVGRDLTMVFRSAMTRLYKMAEVGKVKLNSGLISYTLNSSPLVWRAAPNPFATDLKTMQIPVLPPAHLNQLMQHDDDV